MLEGEWIEPESQCVGRRRHRSFTKLVLEWPPGDNPQLLDTKR